MVMVMVIFMDNVFTPDGADEGNILHPLRYCMVMAIVMDNVIVIVTVIAIPLEALRQAIFCRFHCHGIMAIVIVLSSPGSTIFV